MKMVDREMIILMSRLSLLVIVFVQTECLCHLYLRSRLCTRTTVQMITSTNEVNCATKFIAKEIFSMCIPFGLYTSEIKVLFVVMSRTGPR